MSDRMMRQGLLRLSTIVGIAALCPAAMADDLGGSEACLAGKLQRAEWVEPSKALDEETGRDLRHFPPDRIVDYLHMKLQMRFDNLDDMRFTATQTLRFEPIGAAASAITLDAVGLDITAVTLDNSAVEHYQDDETLTLRFDPPLPPGQPQEIVIQYVCDHPYAGLFFTPSSPQAPHYTAQVHTHGQPETNRHWFVSHDFPNERMTTELIVDVPSGLGVSANGQLISRRDDGRRAVWHYLQDKPHVSYLVSLIIGQFEIVEIPHSRVPMQVWAPQGKADQVMQTYGRTGERIDLFEKRLGVPYPWDRYGQVVTKNFGGGMENTSVTTMYSTAVLDKTALLDGDIQGLIAHELCHQWTGDLITCKSWAHIWLNEGWATYGAALWFEHRDGEDGYLDSIRSRFRRVTARDKTGQGLPMVSPIYDQPRETFRRAANPYPKGASILHMLRRMLGDEIFFEGVHLYMNRHALGVVETNDFRYAMEEVSGLGLEWFFEQWCYRPGVPELSVDVRYDGKSRELLVDIEQTQHIDEQAPAYRFTLPIFVRTENEDHTFDIEVQQQQTSYRAVLDSPPTIVAVDPYLHVLKKLTVQKPQAMWTVQAIEGPSIAARHGALQALEDVDSPETIELLSSIIRDESQRHTLRNTALDSLAKYGSAQAKAKLLSIASDGVAEARVRSSIVGKLAKLEKDDVVELLANIAANDPSYATRVAAIDGLAHHEAAEHADLIVQLADFPSQHDQVRQAALRALAKLDDARGLELAMKYAAYGNMDRARPTAIETIGKLAEHDQDTAVEYLLELLNDPERRAVRAAAAALADIGDERAIAPIQAMAESHPNPQLRESAEGWLEKLEKAQQETDTESETTAP